MATWGGLCLFQGHTKEGPPKCDSYLFFLEEIASYPLNYFVIMLLKASILEWVIIYAYLHLYFQQI